MWIDAPWGGRGRRSSSPALLGPSLLLCDAVARRMLKERDGMGPTEGAAASATAAAAGGGGAGGGPGGASPGAPGRGGNGGLAAAMSLGGGGGGLEAASCAGCGCRISDRFYLLAVDRQWHSSCLKCCECKLPLHSELTCFSRDGNIYCKEDYYRLFAVKRCGRCRAGISASELVMRAREAVYHVQCFTCASCERPLTKGEQFGMRDGLVYCRSHYALLFPPHGAYCITELEGGASERHPVIGGQEGILVFGGEEENVAAVGGAGRLPASGAASFFGGGGNKGRPRKRKTAAEADMLPMRIPPPPGLEMLHPGDLAPAIEQLAAFDSSVGSPGSSGGGMGQQGGSAQQRTKRMRTSFKHHQLRTMKSYFAINQNPDAKDLKQLAQKTGLSKRVLQVWFQNARAKWRRNMMRQESQQGGPGASSGAPPCASSPSDRSAPHGQPHLPPHQPHLGDGICPPPPHGAGPEDLTTQGLPFGELY